MVQNLCPSDKDIVYWNVDEFYKITNETHDRKTNSYRLTDLRKFLRRRFCATCKELISVTNELLRNLNEFSNFVGHDGGR